MNSTRNPSPQQTELTKPTPLKPGRPDGLAPSLKGAPEDVRYGVWAWQSVAAMQFLYYVVYLVGNLTDPRNLNRVATRYLEENPDLGNAGNVSAAQLGSALNVTITLFGITASLLCAWLAQRAGRGAPFARTFLNIGSGFLAINALIIVFSEPANTLPIGFTLILGILTICSGVVGVLGVWFFFRPGNRQWLGVPSDEEVEDYVAALDRYQEEHAAKKKAERERKNSKKSEKNKQNDERR